MTQEEVQRLGKVLDLLSQAGVILNGLIYEDAEWVKEWKGEGKE